MLEPLVAGTAPRDSSLQSTQSDPSAFATAFASYAQSDPAHRQRVLEAVQRLRRDGIDCYSDHFEPFPKEGWPEWMRRQLKRARWILVFASEAYKRRAEGQEEPARGLGVIWEHGEIRRELNDAGRINERFVPVGFGSDRTYVPSILSEYSYFNLDSPEDYWNLLSVLKGEPLHTPEPLGGAPSASQTSNRGEDPSRTPRAVGARGIQSPRSGEVSARRSAAPRSLAIGSCKHFQAFEAWCHLRSPMPINGLRFC